jgi:sec-independent protein translocase protein TatC
MATVDPLAAADDNPHDVRMSFGDHLEELRSRLIKALLATIVVGGVAFYYQNEVMELVLAPYREVAQSLRMDASLKSMGASTALFVYMQVSLVVALIVAGPIWMSQIWGFISVGLYPKEKRWAYRFAPLIFGLFAGGIAFGYRVLIPLALQFLLSFGDPHLVQNWVSLDSYVSLFAVMTLFLGLMFQLPVVMALLAKIGIVGVQGFRKSRRYFILGTFVLSAVMTPPDYVSQCLMAAPTVALFELGIFLAWLSEGERRAPIAWRVWRRRFYWAAGIAALLLFFSTQIRDYYAGQSVASKVLQKDDGPGVPYLQLLGQSDALGFEPTALYRLAAPTEQRERWCAWNAKHAGIVDVAFSDNRLTKMGQDDHETRFLLMQGSQSIVTRAVETLAAKDFVPGVLFDLRAAKAEDRALLSQMLANLVGSLPAGVKPLDASPDVDTAGANLAGWEMWWKANPDWVYSRRRP